MEINVADDKSGAQLTIGMPVRNAAGSISSAIDSILGQTFSNFVLVISDNCSTDETSEICRRYARTDARVIFYEQPTNLGAQANFKFVFDQASTEYFVWAAADDVRSSNYLKNSVEVLELDSNAAISGGINSHTNRKRSNVVFDIRGNSEERTLQFLCVAGRSNGLFYSVFRRIYLEDFVFPQEQILAFDWAIIVHLLQKGNFVRNLDSFLYLGNKGESTDALRWKRWRNQKIKWAVPFFDFNTILKSYSADFSPSTRVKISRKLLRINLLGFLDQINVELRRFLKRKKIVN